MDRFEFDESDDFDYIFDDHDDDDEGLMNLPNGASFLMFPQTTEALQMAQTGMLITELNQKMLQIALQLAEKTWFWRWKSPEKKLKIVENIYNKLNDIIDQTYNKEM
jgi:hypothetical protein